MEVSSVKEWVLFCEYQRGRTDSPAGRWWFLHPFAIGANWPGVFKGIPGLIKNPLGRSFPGCWWQSKDCWPLSGDGRPGACRRIRKRYTTREDAPEATFIGQDIWEPRAVTTNIANHRQQKAEQEASATFSRPSAFALLALF